jgi:hypothetical protein
VNRHSLRSMATPGLAAVLGLALTLMMGIAPVAAVSGPNLVANGSFEEGFVVGLDVPQGWGYFHNDPASVGFHDDQWSEVVASGAHSQLIEIHRSTLRDTYAGIVQTVNVVPGQKYWLGFLGAVRTDDPAAVASNKGYSLEYAIDQSGNRDWQHVSAWVQAPWRTQLRTGTEGDQSIDLSQIDVFFTARGSRVSLFIRAHKSGASDKEGDFNIDGVEIIPVVPGREAATGTFGQYHSHSALDAEDGDPLNAVRVDAAGDVLVLQDMSIGGNAAVQNLHAAQGVLADGSLSTAKGVQFVEGQTAVGASRPGQAVASIAVVDGQDGRQALRIGPANTTPAALQGGILLDAALTQATGTLSTQALNAEKVAVDGLLDVGRINVRDGGEMKMDRVILRDARNPGVQPSLQVLANREGKSSLNIAGAQDQSDRTKRVDIDGELKVRGETTVAGTLRASEIIVTNTLGADFVFEDRYDLAPLSEVAHYVRANNHLPDVPSAAEMRSAGMSLGDLYVRLLRKVEELTLYAIAQEQRIGVLEGRLASQQQTIGELQRAALENGMPNTPSSTAAGGSSEARQLTGGIR